MCPINAVKTRHEKTRLSSLVNSDGRSAKRLKSRLSTGTHGKEGFIQNPPTSLASSDSQGTCTTLASKRTTSQYKLPFLSAGNIGSSLPTRLLQLPLCNPTASNRASQIRLQHHETRPDAIVLDIENMLRLNCPPDKVSRPLKCTQVMQTRSGNVPISRVSLCDVHVGSQPLRQVIHQLAFLTCLHLV